MKRTKLLNVFISLALVGSVLAACGQKDSSTVASPAASTKRLSASNLAERKLHLLCNSIQERFLHNMLKV